MESFYIIATPIGNLEDITLRALDTLKKVDFIVCEDTRVSSKLLSKYSIKKPLIVYNDHSDIKVRAKVLDLLNQEKIGALISDAGTPLISDPGYKLIKEIKDKNFKVTSLPGASSVITALSIAALPTNRFLFEGYLPTKTTARKKILTKLSTLEATLIFFESRNRLLDTLKDMLVVFGNREATVARELTKLYEETVQGNLIDLIEKYGSYQVKGEIVILVSGASPIEIDDNFIVDELIKYCKTISVRDAVDFVVNKYSLTRKRVYDLARKLT